MVALQEQWQASRQLRQQEVVQRRQVVQAELSTHQQTRQKAAHELRQTLAEDYKAVQAETHQYLAQVKHQRQIQASQAADKLKEFDAELRETVADIRTQNRQDMKRAQKYAAELQEFTQQELAGHRRDRVAMGRHQEQKLAKYADELEASVSDYLSEISQKRQKSAEQERIQRQRERAALSDQVQALRDDYAIYGQQMKAFRKNLSRSVWGDTPPGVTPTASSGSPSTTDASKSTYRNSEPQPPSVASSSPASSIAAPEQSGRPVSTPFDGSTEAAVYRYLQTSREGARLPEVEAALGINRVRAVDALRSLIQKDLILQTDRTYYVQGDTTL